LVLHSCFFARRDDFLHRHIFASSRIAAIFCTTTFLFLLGLRQFFALPHFCFFPDCGDFLLYHIFVSSRIATIFCSTTFLFLPGLRQFLWGRLSTCGGLAIRLPRARGDSPGRLRLAAMCCDISVSSRAATILLGQAILAAGASADED
jgi:hypothetical protein